MSSHPYFKVKSTTDNVAGVKLPKFEHYLEGNDSKSDMTGLGKGGIQLQACKKAYMVGRCKLDISLTPC